MFHQRLRGLRAITAVGALLLVSAVAQGQRGRTPSPPPVIDTIIIDNHNIFDDDGPAPKALARLADALHVRTHASVIRRTLVINPGDPYDSARVLESARALRALNAFRRVEIDTERVDGRLALRIETADGWSTNPQFTYSSVGGSSTWGAGVVEENLFGTATSLSAIYTNTPDRSSSSFYYMNPHFLARRPRVAALYEDLSDGRHGAWELGIPFYETAARQAVGTSGESGRQRVLMFRDGRLTDSTVRHLLRLTVNGAVAMRATTQSFFRVWIAGAWRREDFAPVTANSVPYSGFGTIGAGIDVGQTRLLVLDRFNTYARHEDINLSQTLHVGVWGAPRAWGYSAARAGVGLEVGVQQSALWHGGFALLALRANGVSTSDGLDSARAYGMVTVAQQQGRQTALVHAEAGLLRRPSLGQEFDSWPLGPRLFGIHAFTGTRTVWIALEDRILVAEEVSGLFGFGVAPFFDWGGAWYDTESLRAGSDVGISLRVGPTRASRADVSEFSIGYRFGARMSGAGWALAAHRSTTF